jgi:hypothetical protein
MLEVPLRDLNLLCVLWLTHKIADPGYPGSTAARPPESTGLVRTRQMNSRPWLGAFSDTLVRTRWGSRRTSITEENLEHGIMGIVIATCTKKNYVRTPPYTPCDRDGSLFPLCCVKISAGAITTEAGKYYGLLLLPWTFGFAESLYHPDDGSTAMAGQRV